MSEAHKTAKDARKAKLEAALKENLRRRKAQARARKAVGAPVSPVEASKQPLARPDPAKEPG